MLQLVAWDVEISPWFDKGTAGRPLTQKNFGRPIEWGLVKKYPWSAPVLKKLDHPVDPDGNPWPLVRAQCINFCTLRPFPPP